MLRAGLALNTCSARPMTMKTSAIIDEKIADLIPNVMSISIRNSFTTGRLLRAGGIVILWLIEMCCEMIKVEYNERIPDANRS